jgi:hypothetical protein
MNKGTIYLSSTDYDLRDTRQELAEFMNSLGYRVICFEKPDFPGTGEKDRHDRCVKAVDDADYVVVLADRRAGAAYKGSKYYPNLKDKITITYAEATRAIELKKQIALCVRKETWDYRETYNQSTKRKRRMGSKPTEPESRWVGKKDRKRLIALLDLVESYQPSWLHQFSHVTELKDALGSFLDEHEKLGGCSYRLFRLYRGAFLQAQALAPLLKQIYRRHSGEIWLLNNDLELIKSSLFDDVYVKAFKPNSKIAAIRLLLDREKYRQFTDTKCAEHKKLLNNLKQLGDRLSDIYVGPLEMFSDMKNLLVPGLNVVLYTSKNDPDDPDSVALLRPHFAPFCAGRSDGPLGGEDLLIACRQPHLPEVFARMKTSFRIKDVFEDTTKFKRLGLASDKSHLVFQ